MAFNGEELWHASYPALWSMELMFVFVEGWSSWPKLSKWHVGVVRTKVLSTHPFVNVVDTKLQ